MNQYEWYASGQWIPVEGRRIFVRSIGQGPPVLVLHGFPTSSYDYSRVAPLLADRFRLILFDYPGYGFSDKPQTHAYSLFESARCLKAVADYFGIERAFLLAHDIGDSIALITLLRRELVIDRLVLLNGSVIVVPFDDPLRLLTQRVLLNPAFGPRIGKAGLINKRFFAETTKKLFSYPLPPPELDTFWSIITYNHGNRVYPLLMHYMQERWQYQEQWLEAFTLVPVPLTLIWGLADPIATPEVADTVAALRPDAVDVRLEGVGHYPHWEAPERVAEAVIRAFG